MSKDQELTKKELTELCRKQEEYIKELEEKLKGSETKKIEVAKPDYEELRRVNQVLDDKIFKLKEENEALRFSLTEIYMKLKSSQSREEIWEEDYYKEQKRAEKLFDELEKITSKEEFEKIGGPIECPKCYSTKVKALYRTSLCGATGDYTHYICNECHEEFDV